MKKRLCCIALIGSLLLVLSGCGNAIPEMSDEQMNMVTEYTAALLLKYDANYQPMLLDQEQLEEEEEIQKEIAEEAARMEALEAAKEAAKNESENQDETTRESAGSESEQLDSVTPAEFLELEQVSVSYNGIEYVDTYPTEGDDLFFALNASEGCKLAVIHLTVENLADTENSVDVFDKDPKFKVSFNGGEYHNTLMTLLEDDFSVYTGSLAAKEKIDTVLIVDLKEEECQEPESLNLYIKYNGSSIKTALY